MSLFCPFSMTLYPRIRPLNENPNRVIEYFHHHNKRPKKLSSIFESLFSLSFSHIQVAKAQLETDWIKVGLNCSEEEEQSWQSLSSLQYILRL